MSTKLFKFPSIRLALSFVREVTPSASLEAWRSLENLTIHHGGIEKSAGLEVVEPRWPKKVVEKLLPRLSAKPVEPSAQRSWAQSVPMQQFFRRVQLVHSPKTERTIRCLVIPRRDDTVSTEELIIELANSDGWSIWTRAIENVGVIYELRSADGRLKAPPCGLPGQPFVLTEMDDDVFVPSGWELPLLPSFRSLMPPSEPNRLHVWLPTPNDRAQYKLLTEIEGEALPLVGTIALEEPDESSMQIAMGGASRVEVPLRLRRTSRRRDIRQAAKFVYRVVSRSGQFGPALLNLFDRAEARIEDFIYYSQAHGEGPNALVEHYLLSNSRIADEDFWPELERFDLPQTLHEVGLPLFIPASAEFLPNLDGLIQGIDAEDPFLKKLSEQVGLSENRDSRMALVEPFGDDGHWRVIVLERGQPLHRLLQVVLGEMNREPLRQVIDVGRVDLTADRKQYEEKWQEIGKQEGQELVELTSILLRELQTLADSIDQELTRLNQRLGPAQEVSRSASQLVNELPARFDEFARRVSQWLNLVAGPRHEWLMSTDARGQALAQVGEDLRTLERNAHQLVSDTVAQADSTREDLETQRQNLTNAGQELADSEGELDRALRAGAEAAQLASREIEEREQRSEQRLQEARAQEQRVIEHEVRVAAREQEVNEFAARVQAREQQVAAREQALTLRRQTLEQRQRSAEQREQAANQETARLEVLETVAIPETVRRMEEAERLLAEIRGREIDRQYEEVSRTNERLQQELSEAQAQEQVLRELEKQVQARQKQLQELKRQIKTLTEKKLDLSIARRTQELAERESQLNALQEKAARLELIETQDLPAAQSRVEQAEQRLAELRDLGIEERLADVEARGRLFEQDVASANLRLVDWAAKEKQVLDRHRALEQIELEMQRIENECERQLQSLESRQTELNDRKTEAFEQLVRLRHLETEELPELQFQVQEAQKSLDALLAEGIEEKLAVMTQTAQKLEPELADLREQQHELVTKARQLQEVESEIANTTSRIAEMSSIQYDARIAEARETNVEMSELFGATEAALTAAQQAMDVLRAVQSQLRERSSFMGAENVVAQLANTEQKINDEVAAVVSAHPAKRRANARRTVRRIEKRANQLKKDLGIEQRRSWWSFLFGGRK